MFASLIRLEIEKWDVYVKSPKWHCLPTMLMIIATLLITLQDVIIIISGPNPSSIESGSHTSSCFVIAIHIVASVGALAYINLAACKCSMKKVTAATPRLPRVAQRAFVLQETTLRAASSALLWTCIPTARGVHGPLKFGTLVQYVIWIKALFGLTKFA